MASYDLLVKICYLKLNLLDLQILARKLLPFATIVRLAIFSNEDDIFVTR